MKAALEAAAAAMKESQRVRSLSVADTGIMRQETELQDGLLAHLASLAGTLEARIAEEDSIVALQSFTEFLQCWDYYRGGYVEI